MPNNRQQAFGDLDKDPKDGDSGAQGGADGAKGNDGSKDPKGGDSNPQSEPKGKTYTDEELDKIIKARIAREKTAWEKALQDEKDKLTEAQKLEKMNAQEKAEYELKKLQGQIADLEREKSFNEQMAVARKTLSEKNINLSDTLLKKLVSPEAEATKATLDEFIPLWQKEVNDAVQDALKRNSPPAANAQGGKAKSAAARYAEKRNQQFNPTKGGN